MLKKIVAPMILLSLLVIPAFSTDSESDPAAVETASATKSGDNISKSIPGAGDKPVLQQRNWRYRLCPGDVLDLNFTFTPEFNQTVTVQPDGFVTLRELGDIKVEGKTTPELSQTLRTAYAKILHDPVLTIEITDFEKPYFIASGEVGKPGKYDLRGATTVVQAIAIAGGFTANSKHSQVVLFRRISDDWVEAMKLDVKEMLKTANLHEDPYLRPGDMLFVPKNAISKIERYLPRPSLGAYFPINP